MKPSPSRREKVGSMIIVKAGMDKAQHLRHREILDRAWAAEVRSRHIVYPFISDKYSFFSRKEHHVLMNHNDHDITHDFSGSKSAIKAMNRLKKYCKREKIKPDERIFKDTFDEDKIWALWELAELGEGDTDNDECDEVGD